MSLEQGYGNSPRDTSASPTPLAIIGIGCIFPGASDTRAFWANIKNKVDSIGPVPESHWRAEDYFDADPKAPDRTYAARGGFLSPIDFNPIEFGIAPADLDAIDTAQLLGLVAARQALDDAGYGPGREFDRERVSVVLGVTGTQELVIPLGARLGHPRWRKALKDSGVDAATTEEVVTRIADSYVEWQENSFPGLLGNVVAGRIANRLDLHGTNCVVDAACASSLGAIHLAGMELQTGRADLAVTGGVDTFNDIFMYMCFSKTPALSPTGNAKPFDAAGDGTILGEGLGIVVLKRLADAERDGDRVYAVIRSIGTASDGKGNAIYAPSAAGQVRTLRRAYEQAGISPATVELIEGHGTGTRVGDSVEANALTEVFRSAQPNGSWCALGSIKSQIGHTKAAAGAAGLIKAALALHHKVIPPTIKVSQPVEALKSGPFDLNGEKRPWLARPDHPRRAGVSSFGFGGSNFHVVLEEHQLCKSSVDWDGDVEIVALSAESREGLKNKLNALADKSWSGMRADAAGTRRDFRVDASCRLLLVVQRDTTDLTRLVASAKSNLDRLRDSQFWHTPDGAFFGSGPATGQLGIVFPGQGSQYVGMLRDLACQFPEMLTVLGDANRVFARSDESRGGRLSDYIYPPSRFIPGEKQADEDALRQTAIAQPAIGAVSIGALAVLERFGVEAGAYAGHSYGELPALCAAGCFDADALHSLSRLRGHLMASCRGGDAGAMLAVHAPLADIEEVLRTDGLRVVIANRNAPNQAVLSGETAEVIRAGEAFSRRQVRHTRLSVAAAFHSPLIASAERPFRESLDSLDFRAAIRPVFANTTSKRYPNEPAAIRAILAGQLSHSVDFVTEIKNMAGAGITTFLEVGPGATLSRLVSSILESESPDPSWDAFALDASGGKRSGVFDLALVLARLAARGHRVDLQRWEDAPAGEHARTSRPGLTIPLCGANYVKPRPATPAAPQANEMTLAKIATKAQPKTTSGMTASKHPMIEPNPNEPAPMPTRPSAPPGAGLQQALQLTQRSLEAFQRLQDQTAQLHRQFLENQEAAQRTLQTLVEQQQVLLAAGGTMPALAAPRSADQLDVAPKAIKNIASSAPPPLLPSPPVPKPRVAAAPTMVVPPRTDFSSVLIAVVAEKTGYPAEMLDLGMALDADLGIDSIKRVEILSALQDRLPGAPVVKPEHLGTLHTLRDVAAFLSQVPAAQSDPKPGRAAELDVGPVLLSVVAEKTGYPAEMLELDMALDADLGIDSIKRVEIFSALQERLPDAPPIKPEQLGTLHTLQDVATLLRGCSNGESARPVVAVEKTVRSNGAAKIASANATVKRYVLAEKPLGEIRDCKQLALAGGALIWIVGDDSLLVRALANDLMNRGYGAACFTWDSSPVRVGDQGPGGLVFVAPQDLMLENIGTRALGWIRAAAEALKRNAAGKGAMLACVTRFDGSFGIRSMPRDADPTTSALVGLVKSAACEWPEVQCKAIDLDSQFTGTTAAAIVDELLVNGPLEVGIRDAGRFAVELVHKEPSRLPRAVAFRREDTVVVTGGARGVTFACTLEIARRFAPQLVILGRTELKGSEPESIAHLTDETAIKKVLASHLGAESSPRKLAEECRAILARRELRKNLGQLEAAGARFKYIPVDVADPAALGMAFDAIRREFGPITGLIHGAGVLADRRLEELTDEQFQSVYAIKVNALQTLLKLTASDPLRNLVLFSSTTARFGRIGQAAYAAANEVLNKIAQQQARLRPECRVAAINWGPWEGGMVTPSLRNLFEAEGIGLIPLKDGAEFLIHELECNDHATEVVALAGDLPVKRETAPAAQAAAATQQWTLAFEQSLTVEDVPVLRSHVIGGRPVLPLALQLEWLAHGALHCNPGLSFLGCDELRVLHGAFADGATASVSVYAGKAQKQDGAFLVPVELRSNVNGRQVVHSRARMVLGAKLPSPTVALAKPTLDPYPNPVAEAYRFVLFHDLELQGIEEVTGVGDMGIQVICRTAPPPADWMKCPLRSTWIADPLALDCAFQAAILWSSAVHDAGSLPCFAGSYRQFVRIFPPGRITIAMRVTSDNGAIARADIDFVDASGRLIAQMRDYECAIDPSLNESFRRNKLVPVAVR